MFYVTFFSLKQNKEVASWRRQILRQFQKIQLYRKGHL